MTSSNHSNAGNTVRLDKWLWAARFFKTRSLATAAVESGKVQQNEDRVKPAHNVKVGDLLTIDNDASGWEIVVLGLSQVRGSAPVAQALYRETEKSIAKRQLLAEQKKYYIEPGNTLKGRPTKRDRRLLDKTNS